MGKLTTEWDAAAVRAWLESRVAAARADQVTAERRGREGRTTATWPRRRRWSAPCCCAATRRRTRAHSPAS